MWRWCAPYCAPHAAPRAARRTNYRLLTTYLPTRRCAPAIRPRSTSRGASMARASCSARACSAATSLPVRSSPGSSCRCRPAAQACRSSRRRCCEAWASPVATRPPPRAIFRPADATMLRAHVVDCGAARASGAHQRKPAVKADVLAAGHAPDTNRIFCVRICEVILP